VGRKISDVGDRGNAGFPGEMAEILQVKKDIYPLNMEGF
jgi:hypothetical protein